MHEQALPIDGPVVNVERFEDMLRLAQIEGAPILHLADGEQHEWATSAMGIWYRYLLLPSAIGAAAAEMVEGDRMAVDATDFSAPLDRGE